MISKTWLAGSTSSSVEMENAILEDISQRIIDEQVRPWLAERIYRSIDLSPADLRTLGLDGWDAGRMAREIAHAMLESQSIYSLRFRSDAIDLSYDPEAPIDQESLERAFVGAYPIRGLVSEAMVSAERYTRSVGPAFVDATGHVMSRFEHNP